MIKFAPLAVVPLSLLAVAPAVGDPMRDTSVQHLPGQHISVQHMSAQRSKSRERPVAPRPYASNFGEPSLPVENALRWGYSQGYTNYPSGFGGLYGDGRYPGNVVSNAGIGNSRP